MFRRTFLKTIAALAFSVASIGNALGITSRRVKKIKSKYLEQVKLPIFKDKETGIEYVFYAQNHFYTNANKSIQYKLVELTPDSQFNKIDDSFAEAPSNWKYAGDDRTDKEYEKAGILFSSFTRVTGKAIPVVYTGGANELPKPSEEPKTPTCVLERCYQNLEEIDNRPDLTPDEEVVSVMAMESIIDKMNDGFANGDERRKAMRKSLQYPGDIEREEAKIAAVLRDHVHKQIISPS